MIVKPLPLEEAKEVEIVKGPNIKFLPIPEKPQQNFCVPVSLKGGDNISTDDITPASAEFSSMRSNIPLMSQYCYHRYAPDFAAKSQRNGKKRDHRWRKLWTGIFKRTCSDQPNVSWSESSDRKEYCTYP
ncbi:MAG: hypothetical protein ACLUTO_02655 [Anaerostipes sp.]